jgi:hypothetical protein
VNCLRAIRLQGLHRGANAGQRNHAVECATALRDRYRKLRHGLPRALDQRRCFLWKKHKSSWCHHACSEFCCRCARHDSHFRVGPQRQWYGYNDHDLCGCTLATPEHQACNVLIGSGCICNFRDRYRIRAASRIRRSSKLPSSRFRRLLLRNIDRRFGIFFLVAAHPRPLVFNASAVLDFTFQLRWFSRILTTCGGCCDHPIDADYCRKTQCDMRSSEKTTHKKWPTCRAYSNSH